MGLIKNYKLYTQLSKVLNFSFGTAGPGTARISTQDVNLVLYDEELLNAKFQMIVNVGSTNALATLMPKFKKEGQNMIDATLKKAAEDYKEMFPKEKPVKFEVNTASAHDDVEFIHYSSYTPTLRGYYRLSCMVKISH